MKFTQLIEYDTRNILIQKTMHKNEAGKLVPAAFCFLKKLFIRQKEMVCSLISLYFDSPKTSIL